jgi:hypothetical protein
MGAWERKRAANQRRRELRRRAVAYLGGSCRICGYEKCTSAFDFHHVNALEKDFTISAKMTSWDAIKAELDKCVLLCCRCHREVHDGLHAGYMEDETHSRGRDEDDERQVEMFDDELPETFLDPSVTPEQIRAAVDSVPESPRPTMLDMLAPLD